MEHTSDLSESGISGTGTPEPNWDEVETDASQFNRWDDNAMTMGRTQEQYSSRTHPHKEWSPARERIKQSFEGVRVKRRGP